MDKNKVNLYFTNYQRLEHAVLDLSFSIHFSDDQIDVYSVAIADLIMRCATDIESIAKDLCRENFKFEPAKPGDCFNSFEQEWQITKKSLLIVCPYFNFKNNFAPKLQPFNYENGSENDYFSQYNALKHDKTKNLSKATVGTLIRILGALYILNLYYKRDAYPLGNDCFGTKIDKTMGSKIFSVFVYPSEEGKNLSSNKDISSEECMYRIVKTEGQGCISVNCMDADNKIRTVKVTMVNDDFQTFVKECANTFGTGNLMSANGNQNLLTAVHSIGESACNILNCKQIISLHPDKLADIFSLVLNT